MHQLDVLIEGAHCGACIQKIESRLRQNPQVREARLNFSTRCLHLAWQGKPDDAANLVQQIEDLGYSVHPSNQNDEQEPIIREQRDLLFCLAVAGFASGNIMLLSLALWITTGEMMGEGTRVFFHAVSALIAVPAGLYSGRPFFASAMRVLSRGQTNMDVPISVGIILTLGVSLFQLWRHAEHAYFDSVVMLTFFLLVGRYLDLRARAQARRAATDLLSSLSGFAQVVGTDGTQTRRIPIHDLRADMIIRVVAGEKFPVDSVVIDGQSDIDQSLVTGETIPRAVANGDQVYGGTINISAPLALRVARAAPESLLADIVRLMDKATQSQSQYVRLADRAARLYTPVVHILAVASFLYWIWGMGVPPADALIVAATVLIITCPCALGLAVPVVHVLTSGVLFRRGVLLKSGDAIERLAAIDTVLLDKTGTLTQGTPELVLPDDSTVISYLPIAAALAAYSAHPLSRALRAGYDGVLQPVTDVREYPGQGITGTINGQKIRLGSASFCGVGAEKNDNGLLSVYMSIDGYDHTRYQFRDAPRDDAMDVVRGLMARGLRVEMLSGDRLAVAKELGLKLGIDTVYAECSPQEKFSILERHRAQGRRVLMVGDGLNDAPVLAGADVSMAPGTAIDMAQNAADIVFMGKNLASVLRIYDTAVFAQKLVRQNFFLAIVYNVFAVPLAMAGMVTPLVAAIAMSSSSLVVIANSFRIRMQA